jgi:hypothetical protein
MYVLIATGRSVSWRKLAIPNRCEAKDPFRPNRISASLILMARLLAVVAIVLALLAMERRQQHEFTPLPTGPMPAALIP